MDHEKLKQLRERYADRGVYDGDDPVLSRAAREVQSPDGKRALPYSGIPTFLGLPYATSAAELDIALVGVPMDLGVSNRSGARFGPRAVRQFGEGKTLAGTSHSADREWKEIVPQRETLHVSQPHHHNDE